MFAGALERLAELLISRREYRQAIVFLQRLARHDPLREATYRRLIQLYALRGDRAAALRVYHVCATVLQRELDAEPGPETRQAYERLINLAEPPAPERPLAIATLVGREREWAALQRAWDGAARRPALALIAGEAGIGKTRLAEDLLDWAARQGVTTAAARCYATEGRLAYTPVVEWLRAEPFHSAVRMLDRAWLGELTRLMPELLTERTDLPLPGPLTEAWQRRRLFEALARAALSPHQPILLLLDDLQWCDQDTLEWLHYLIRFDERAGLLVVGTLRAGELAADHPATALLAQLDRAEALHKIELDRLSASETAILAAEVSGRALAPQTAARLHAETEGNPLFIVEMARAGLERFAPGVESFELQLSLKVELPSRVRVVIKSRLAQLTPLAREMAGVAAVIGRAFRFDILARGGYYDDDTLVRGLDELWRRRIVREHGVDTYDFSHDKIREVAYAGLGSALRRQIHQRVARAIESLYQHNLDLVSGQLAAHLERGGLIHQALPFYLRAAQVALRLSAHQEAIGYLTRGLEVLRALPETPERDQQELALQAGLGAPLIATRGYAAPEVERALARARELCRCLGDTPQLFRVLWGLGRFYLVRPNLAAGLEVGRQLLAMAERAQSPDLLLEAHNSVGAILFHLGDWTAAAAHLARGADLYDAAQHRNHACVYGQDPGVVSLSRGAIAWWFLGYPDRSLDWSRRAIDLSNQIGHPFSQAFALAFAANMHQVRGERELAFERAVAVIPLSIEQGFPLYAAMGVFFHGWALFDDGEIETGIELMRQGLHDYRSTGAELTAPYFQALLAEANSKLGQTAEGLRLLDEAQMHMESSGERWWEPELHRLRAELLLRHGVDVSEAEEALRRAIDTARRQSARVLELRVLTRLCQLQRTHGHTGDALPELRTAYHWFTEGVATPDLVAARALLEES